MLNIFTVFDIITNLTLAQVTEGATEKMAGSDIYIVLIVTLIVWGGIFFYLMYLDSKLKRLKNKIDTLKR